MGRWPSKPSQRRPSRNRRGSSAGEFSPVGARHPDVFPINSGKGDPQASRACSAMAILAAPEGAQFEHIGRYGLCFDRLIAFDRDAGGGLSVRDTLFARPAALRAIARSGVFRPAKNTGFAGHATRTCSGLHNPERHRRRCRRRIGAAFQSGRSPACTADPGCRHLGVGSCALCHGLQHPNDRHAQRHAGNRLSVHDELRLGNGSSCGTDGLWKRPDRRNGI